jgi:hypothetical protein
VNSPSIAPANGSEHFAQNGGVMRWALSWHDEQRYSEFDMAAPQAPQFGG